MRSGGGMLLTPFVYYQFVRIRMRLAATPKYALHSL
mgnify:CR=1 FL=1